MGFAMIHSSEKLTDCFFCDGNVFVFVLRIVSINQCTMHFPDHSWPDLIITYYSHKNSYFGKKMK